jgi:hypothetical protein
MEKDRRPYYWCTTLSLFYRIVSVDRIAIMDFTLYILQNFVGYPNLQSDFKFDQWELRYLHFFGPHLTNGLT